MQELNYTHEICSKVIVHARVVSSTMQRLHGSLHTKDLHYRTNFHFCYSTSIHFQISQVASSCILHSICTWTPIVWLASLANLWYQGLHFPEIYKYLWASCHCPSSLAVFKRT